MALIEEVGVASVPGHSFYADGGGHRLLRFCFAKDFASLEEAAKRIRSIRPSLSRA
jgi:aminotransferase